MWGFKKKRKGDIQTTATTKIETQTNTALHTNMCSLRLHVIHLHSTPVRINPLKTGLTMFYLLIRVMVLSLHVIYSYLFLLLLIIKKQDHFHIEINI